MPEHSINASHIMKSLQLETTLVVRTDVDVLLCLKLHCILGSHWHTLYIPKEVPVFVKWNWL